MHLTLIRDDPLSNFAIQFNLRRYILGAATATAAAAAAAEKVPGKMGDAIDADVMEHEYSANTKWASGGVAVLVHGRGLHSFTLELNLSNSRTHS